MQWRAHRRLSSPISPADIRSFKTAPSSLLGVLVAEDIVEQLQGSRRYVTGEQIPLLALSRRTRDPLPDIVSPHLRAAVGEFGDTGFFTRLVGLEPACVARELGRLPHPGTLLRCWQRRPLGVSNVCNILFTRRLARWLKFSQVTANALHPGFVATGFGDNIPA
jgi:hypothetical protein